MNLKKLQTQINELVSQANFTLGDDVLRLLRKACDNEEEAKPKKALEWIVENAAIAKIGEVAMCQDTGLPVVFIEVGEDKKISYAFVHAVKDLVEKSYEKLHLRPSLVPPLKRGTPSYKGVICHVEFSPRVKDVKITLFPKGFGSENKTKLKMFNPTANIEDIEDFVVDAVKLAGPESCPPFIVGVGIGGTSDSCLFLAKKALMAKVDVVNSSETLGGIETRLLEKINSLNIGPMGFGGKCTALAVKVKSQHTHIAGLPVGVNISCHALRKASIHVKVR